MKALSFFGLALVIPGVVWANWQDPESAVAETVFLAGHDGYQSYRIPAVICTQRGTLLAFCEGRKHGSGDSGDIDLVLRRSFDGGLSWQPLQVIWDDGENTCGNPCAVIDRSTGTICLLMTRNLGADRESSITEGTSRESRTVWMTSSDDDGATWQTPREITDQVKRPNWNWYATGPGIGIQLSANSAGKFGGRLLIPCDHTQAESGAMYSHVIFSDDGGESWQIGDPVGPDCNECQVAQWGDELVLNMRSYRKQFRRLVSISGDGGQTWSEPRQDETLIEPVCQASLIRLSEFGPDREAPQDLGEVPQAIRGWLIFCNPASQSRQRLTVRASADGGQSWPHSRVLHSGPAAYSCLVDLAGREMGCLYECGDQGPYERIVFKKFSLTWLSEN